ncbi:hypothetical protein OAN21_00625 [Alphaproteobacteria bacterium]|nr:hypothetical protein [Alphaproteobacteria bacterium]
MFFFQKAYSGSQSVYDYKPSHKFKVRRDSWNTVDTPTNQQLSNGVDLIYGTLFQNISVLGEMGLKKYGKETKEQSLLFRRIFLLLGLGGLSYHPDRGESGPWPFPLATVLTQGQRVLIELEGVTAKKLISFLTSHHPSLLHRRRYSSHGALIKSRYSPVVEVKIKNPFRRFSKHEKAFGMDFPLGGVGNVLPNNNLVGPRGLEFSVTKHRLLKKTQLGHLHIYTQDFPRSQKSVILIGVEGCAPGSSNQLGCTHNIISGMRNQKLRRGVSGGLKWSKMDLKIPPPAEYGGKKIHLTKETFLKIKERVHKLMLEEEKNQELLFKKILPMAGAQAKTVLWTYNQWSAD